MAFGQNPVTGSQGVLPANQFPVPAVAPPGNANGDLVALEGGPISTDSNSNKTAPASMYVKDGNNLVEGATTDTAVVGDNPGSLSAKLRGLTKIFNDIWDSVNHRIKVDASGATVPVSVLNFPSTQPVSGTFWQTTQPISGSISVSNFPGTQPVSGTVAATQSGTWTIQPGNTPNTVAWKVDGSAVTQPVSGTFWQATQPVSGTVTANQGGSNWSVNQAQVAGTTTSVNAGTTDAGTQRVAQGGAATGTKSNVASSASSVTILASNTIRKGALIYNDSTAVLYLDLSGGTATSSSYSVQVLSQGFFELPGPTIYNGLITGIWSVANGNARVTEIS